MEIGWFCCLAWVFSACRFRSAFLTTLSFCDFGGRTWIYAGVGNPHITMTSLLSNTHVARISRRLDGFRMACEDGLRVGSFCNIMHDR